MLNLKCWLFGHEFIVKKADCVIKHEVCKRCGAVFMQYNTYSRLSDEDLIEIFSKKYPGIKIRKIKRIQKIYYMRS